ncbi:MAG: discoidin domain-containing protein [Elusimicrobia bacterium]|nr:discoidin domain-containing protein [Elusimicrobiota bacterium]
MKNKLSSPCFLFVCICIGLFISLRTPAYAWDNGLVRTPKMGCNAWCVFTTNISGDNLKLMADGMVSSGLRDAGYIWLEGLCDGWQSTDTLNPDGSQKEDTNKFPAVIVNGVSVNGIKYIVDYTHSKGLKMEISSSPGPQNCSLKLGSYGHEQQDADEFAAWGIDGVYYDECTFHPGSKEEEIAGYALMRDCILRTGRSMIYEISNYGANSVWEWGDPVGNSWRTAGDGAGYDGSNYDKIVDTLYKYAGPGHWNAPEDNAPVGDERVSFSLNCMLAVSLDIIIDFRNMTQATLDRITMYKNKEAIAINQDRLGIAGRRVKIVGNVDIIARPLINGCTAVLIYNRGTSAQNITVNWSDIGLPSGTGMKVFDIWANSDKGTFSGSYTTIVESTNVVMLKLSPPSWTLDTSSPAVINSLVVSSKGRDTMTLSWSAPGNNEMSGTAFEYSIRSATFPITNANWGTASIYGGFHPKAPYSSETFTVPGRKPNTLYYFAIRTADEVGNWSDVSNNAQGTITENFTNLALNKSAKALNVEGTDIESKAVDGDLNTGWIAQRIEPTWIYVDLGATYKITEVILEWGRDPYNSYSKSYAIQISDDKINWTPIYTQTNGVRGDFASTEDIVLGGNDRGRYVRLYVTTIISPSGKTIGMDGWYNLCLREFKIYGNSSTPDIISPSAVNTLTTGVATSNSVSLSWTSVGDDNNTGTASVYDIRYSNVNINDSNWATATQCSGVPAPLVAGTNQSYTVQGLSSGITYYFAMKVRDEVPTNWSGLSNVVSRATNTADTKAPSAIDTLVAGSVTSNSIALSWTSVGDDDKTGTATTYDIRYATFNITGSNWDLAGVTQCSGVPAPLVAGTNQGYTVQGLSSGITYYFAMKVADEVPNLSGISNIVTGQTTAQSNIGRGRPIILNGQLCADNGAPLRGDTPRVGNSSWPSNPDGAGTNSKAEWQRARDEFHFNTGRLFVYRDQRTTFGLSGLGWTTTDWCITQIDKAVQYAEELGMYIIINYSHHPIGYGVYEDTWKFNNIQAANLTKADHLEFWDKVARRYKDKTHVIYEWDNEPIGYRIDHWTQKDIDYQAFMYKYIRDRAPDTHIIMWSFPSPVVCQTCDPNLSFVTVVSSGTTPSLALTPIDYSNASVGWHAYWIGDCAYDGNCMGGVRVRELVQTYPSIMTEQMGWDADYTKDTTTTFNQVRQKLDTWGEHNYIFLSQLFSGGGVLPPVMENPDPYYSNPNIVYPPSFSLFKGKYSSGTPVIIKCGTSGATVRYTIDGSVPSPTGGGTTISGSSPLAVTITQNCKLRAIATKSGMTTSIENSADYTITGPDAISPSAINTLATGVATSNSVALSWTSVGDDNNIGTASVYDIRYATFGITSSNWDLAGVTQCSGEPTPLVAGNNQSYTVNGLSSGITYYFAMKVGDEVSNWSGISNVVYKATNAPDTTPPTVINTLATGSATSNSIALNWTSVGDDNNIGTASVYDIRYATFSITGSNWDSVGVTQCSGEPTPLVAGNNQSYTVQGLNAGITYYFAMKVGDEVPNWSGISNVVSGQTTTQGNIAIGKTATASSEEGAGLEATKAVDGNVSTRWSSQFSDPQWLRIDLVNTYNITQVVLRWQDAGAYGRDYQLQVSSNDINWTAIYTKVNGTGGVETLSGLSGSGRYIRMYGTARGTNWGYSLNEFEVYGTSGTTPAKSITITYPNGGENLLAGSQQTVTWTSVGGVGNVMLQISVDGGTNWSILVANTANDGNEVVTLPSNASSSCLIRLVEIVGGTTDTTNGYFSITVTGQMSFGNTPAGTPWQIGANTTTIELENYDTGGQGEAYNDTTPSNIPNKYRTNEAVDIENCTDIGGGYDVEYTIPSEWLEYSINVSETAEYRIILRGAAGSAGGPVHLEFGSHNLVPYRTTASVNVPNTGGWQTWTDIEVSSDMVLTAGNQIMKLVMESGAADHCGNLNYIKIIRLSSDTTPPVVSTPGTISITGNSIVITWTTNELSNSRVEYGLTTSYGSVTAITDTGGVYNHSVTLSGLAENTTYHYRMVSVDMNGNPTTTVDYSFATILNDPNPPVISNVKVGVTQNGAVITWNTDENSDSQLAYGQTTTMGSTTTLDTTMTRLHSVSISGLLKGKTYYYKVYSKDASNNLAESEQSSFKTYNNNIKHIIYTYYYDDGTTTTKVGASASASLKFKVQVYNMDENSIATDYTGTITLTTKNSKSSVLDTVDSTLLETDAGEKEVSIPFRSDINTIELTGDTTSTIVINFSDMYIGKLVGYQGGTIRGANGLKILIPTGVLSVNKYLASIKTSAVPAVRDTMKYANTVNPICYDFGELTFSNSAPVLENQTFTRAVNITIPYTSADIGTLNEDGLRIYYWSGTDWELVTGVQKVDKLNNTVTATVTHFSTYRILGSYVTVDLNNIKVYPSPYNPATAVNGKLKITNLPINSIVKLYTVTGDIIRELREIDYGNLGWLEWDGKNDNGDKVGKGVYIYKIEDAAGNKKTGKVGLVK